MIRALEIKKQIDDNNKLLNDLRKNNDSFTTRREALNAETEAVAEGDIEALNAINARADELNAEISENDNKITDIEKQIRELENELNEIEAQQAAPAPTTENTEIRTNGGFNKMFKTRSFNTMTVEQRNAIFENEEVKEFAANIRAAGIEKRTVTGGSYVIPTMLLDVLRETVTENSKLIKYVNMQQVAGKSRQTVLGTIPEAVWTEMCGKLNELDLVFNAVELDGYKVGGFVPVCNAILADSDVNLIDEIVRALGAAIAFALDKAILYGTGVKMPLGIASRLAQTEAPADYSPAARAWADLHVTNIKKLTVAESTGAALFKNIVKAFGNAKGKYSRGVKFFAMNSATKMRIVEESISINAAGVVSAGVNDKMPAIGGDIVELDFMPDSTIIAGYGDLYTLAERAGTEIKKDESVRFIEDQTVFKGTARYDGEPAIAEGFVVIGIDNVTPVTTMTFAQDAANA